MRVSGAQGHPPPFMVCRFHGKRCLEVSKEKWKVPGKRNLPVREVRRPWSKGWGQAGTRIPGCALTCRVVDWGPSWVERILRSRTTRWVHETRLWRCRTSFGVRGVLVYWLHWDACHWNLLA